MITANELKVRGVQAIADELQYREEVGITVRGKVKYVVMSVDEYDRRRAAELDLAILEVQDDIANGRYTTSIEDHISELKGAVKKK